MARLPERDLETFWNRLKDVYEYFKSRGISDEIAAGILGNVARESSGFWDNIVNKIKDKKGNIRYFYGGVQNEQLTYDWVKANYGGYTKKHQIQYLADGLLGKLPEVKSKRGNLLNTRFTEFMNKAKNIKSPSQIAYLWESIYELSGKSQLDERQQCAEYFYKQMQKSKTKQGKKTKSNKTSELQFPNYDIYQQFYPEQFTAEQPNDQQYEADNLKSEFDLPLLATQFRNGGKLIKKHQYGGTLASRYIQRYFDPNNPLLTYINFGDAQKAGVQFTNDINNPESGWYFSYDIAKDQQGKDENSREFRNNIGGHIVNPATTYAAIDKNGRIINNKDFNVVVNGESLIPTNGYVFDETKGWIPAQPSSNGQIIDQDMLDQAEQAARFLSDRGFEHAWRMNPEERISFARSVQESDAAGEAAIFGSQIPKAATSTYNWMTGTNTGRAFTSSMLAGEAIDAGSRVITGQSYGDYMASQYGGSPFLWGLTNPGYLAGEGLVAPVKETLEPVVKEAAKSITSKVIEAGKKMFGSEVQPQVALEETVIPKSSLQDRLNGVLHFAKVKKDTKVYTPEQEADILDKLNQMGFNFDSSNPIRILGHFPLSNSFSEAMLNMQKYRLFNYYEPLLSWNVTKEGDKLIDFTLPKQTYFKLNNNGDITIESTRSASQYVDDLLHWPQYFAYYPKLEGNTKGFMLKDGLENTKSSFITSAVEGIGPVPRTISTGHHETFGHGMNKVAQAVIGKDTGTTYRLWLKDMLESLNPELLKTLKLFTSPNMNEDELQSIFSQLQARILDRLADSSEMSIDDLLKLTRENPELVQKQLDNIINNASDAELAKWFDYLGSAYGTFMRQLLPGEQGLAYAIQNPEISRNIIYDLMEDRLRRKGVSYSMDEANAFRDKVKEALKKGFSVTPIIPLLESLHNQQNNQTY